MLPLRHGTATAFMKSAVQYGALIEAVCCHALGRPESTDSAMCRYQCAKSLHALQQLVGKAARQPKAALR